ncbi:MAG: patatin-like phospholipase family protein [Sphingomonadaceae bacterium]
MIPTPVPQYERCMVMAGGGFRFPIYIGMYDALCQAGRAPDVLLASCGGALAATSIALLPDPAQRRDWLASPAMYAYWCALRSTRHAVLGSTLLRALRRKLSRRRVPLIPDLHQDYLFDLPPALPFPPPPAPSPGSPEVAILGGRLLFRADESGQPRGQRKLYEETVFCGPRAAALLEGMAAPLSDPRWGDHAIAPALQCQGGVPLAEAARLSIADMFYFRCQSYGGHDYLGGVLDLFPVEIAARLGREQVLEFKEAFDQTFAIPAWRAVLGVDGNARLQHANGVAAALRIDASDVSLTLARQQLQQRLDWRRNRIELQMPPDYATFVRYIDDQWRYGYTRAQEALQRQPNQPLRIRNANRHSRAR